MRNYVHFKWANIWFSVTPAVGFPYQDFASTIVTGKRGKKNTDDEEINQFISEHVASGSTWVVDSVEKEDVWWLMNKRSLRDLIVESIQKTYIYDLRLFLEEGNNKWNWIRHRSPRKKGRNN